MPRGLSYSMMNAIGSDDLDGQADGIGKWRIAYSDGLEDEDCQFGHTLRVFCTFSQASAVFPETTDLE
jgi:hypothetical protein